ncbi:MAG: type II secretion system GspH family protein [Synergistaceae bacterium]|jgi:prepilin-type N-terminal cleavage/methylation domain-containing protein|nr:type II secretion system GspH family protein [Synergistaceae bacterium]
MRNLLSFRKKAFTLAEVLVVVAIAGIITVTGIIPLMYTVRALENARDSFSADNRERSAVDRMMTDMRGLVRINASAPFRIMRDDKLEGDADYLMLWTSTPALGMAPMGSVVYGVPERTVLSSQIDAGLYRWVLSGDKQPDVILKDDLRPEEARMILPGVVGVTFQALQGSDWEDDYSGQLPGAFRVTFDYGSKDITYERSLPQL